MEKIQKIEYRLRGYESFILREGWITKGIMAVNNQHDVFSTRGSGADVLGVGANMAKAIRYWLRAAGLTKDMPRGGVELTELGKLVLDNDLYIEDTFTLWVIHANIARNAKLATSWNLFFNEIPVSSFKRDELYSMMKERVEAYTGRYDLPERSIKDDCSAILLMYAGFEDEKNNKNTDPENKNISPFSALGLIKRVGTDNYERTRPSRDSIDPLVLYYMIADRLNKEGSLQIGEIADGDDMPGKILYLNRLATNDILDALSDNDYITVNRTAGLDIVYPQNRVSSIEVIGTHYEAETKA